MTPGATTLRSSRGLAWGVLAAYALGFFALVFACASNTPQGDDYAAILEPAARWPTLETWRERLALLSEQHFSHRLVLTKALVAAQITLHGTVNFFALQVFGWLALLVLVGLLVSSSPDIRAQPWLAAPIVLVIFQPQGFTNFQSAMQAVQNLGILLVTFVALQATVSPRRGAGVASVLLAVASAFVSANGLLLGPIAAATAALRRRYALAAAHAIASGLAMLVYFRGFRFPIGSAFDLGEGLTKAAIMAGGAASFDRLPLLFVGLAGAALLVIALVTLFFPPRDEAAPELRPFLGFLLASVFLAALGRLGWRNDYMTQDRYRVYGCLIAVSLYLLLLARPFGRTRIFRLASLTVATGFAIVSFATTLPNMISSARWAEAQAINAQLGQPFFMTSGGGWDEAARLLTVAEQRGVYRLPRVLSVNELAALRMAPKSLVSVPVKFQPNGGRLGFDLVAERSANTARPEFAVLAFGEDRVVLPALLHRAPIGELLRHGHLLASTTTFVVPREVAAASPESVTLTAFGRDHDGQLAPLWQSVAHVPRI